MLHEFIRTNREAIIGRCKAKAAERSVPALTDAAIDHGVPVFLDQLCDTLRLGVDSSLEIGRSAILRGRDLLAQGLTVADVVHEYGDVCQAVTDLALEMDEPIGTDDFRTLNRCLDEAIAGAVTEYGRQRNQSSVDGESARGNERLGFLAHELRNLINTALFAFEVLKTGSVGAAGSTGAVLHRSLLGLQALAARSLTDVNHTHQAQTRKQFLVSGFIDELADAARLEAHACGITLIVMPVEDGVAIHADRKVLAAVVTNLLQNAFKFTRPRTAVTLRVGAGAERVLIEIQDECGGLPAGNVSLFRPFEQRSANRTGMGLGLAFSREGVEANGGRIYARNLPDKGCVFTIDLPRVPVFEMA